LAACDKGLSRSIFAGPYKPSDLAMITFITSLVVVVGKEVSTHEFPCQATSSTIVALAVPPPSHMVCNPYRIPLSRM